MGFSYLGCGVSLHGCSSKAQPLLLILDEGYLLTAALPDLQCGIAPLGLPAPVQPLLLGCSSQLPALASGVGGSPQLPPLALGLGWLLRVTAPGLGLRVAPQGHGPWPWAREFGKLSSGHRTGKGQFSFQSQRKAALKNAQTTAQLHSSHMLVK